MKLHSMAFGTLISTLSSATEASIEMLKKMIHSVENVNIDFWANLALSPTSTGQNAGTFFSEILLVLHRKAVALSF